MCSTEFPSADDITLRRNVAGETADKLKFGSDDDLFVTMHAIGESSMKLFENSHVGNDATCGVAVNSVAQRNSSNIVVCTREANNAWHPYLKFAQIGSKSFVLN